MSDIIVSPSNFNGELNAIPSKSDAHRAIICALVSRSICKISPIILSNDIKATINAARSLGAVCEIEGDTLTVDSTKPLNQTANVDCCESGSTLRFMLPVAAALGVETDFSGSGRLPERPVNEYVPIFESHGAKMSANHIPLTVSGKLKSGEYAISGNVSSQYITGLLIALASLGEKSIIEIITHLESKGYVDMTVRTLKKFGAKIEIVGNKYIIEPSVLSCNEYHVEGDWSQASYFLTAGIIGGDVKVHNLSLSSLQADRRFLGLARQFGADISIKDNTVTAKKSELFGIEVDASQFPDLVPSIAVLAAFAKGDSIIYNSARLRIKEGDRIKSVCNALAALGVETVEYDDGMKIKPAPIKAGNVDCVNDHRIPMAFSVLAAIADEDTTFIGANCIDKSYPTFFEDYEKIGGKCKWL